MALAPPTFSQVRTHIRQRMHFMLSLSGVNRSSASTPISAAISLSCSDSGQRAKRSWRTRRRTFMTRSLFVSNVIPPALRCDLPVVYRQIHHFLYLYLTMMESNLQLSLQAPHFVHFS